MLVALALALAGCDFGFGGGHTGGNFGDFQ